jgi:hypothetical protein
MAPLHIHDLSKVKLTWLPHRLFITVHLDQFDLQLIIFLNKKHLYISSLATATFCLTKELFDKIYIFVREIDKK